MKLNGMLGRMLNWERNVKKDEAVPKAVACEDTLKGELVVKSLVDGINSFSFDLYRKMPKGNAFLSAQNVHQVLSMAFPGARGETANQMAKVLGCAPCDATGLCHDYASIVKRMGSLSESCSLTFANMLWGQEGYPFDPQFVSIAEEFYGAGLKELDFKESQAAADEINGWVKDHTGGKIDRLVDPDMFDELTRLVLTGAVHFKGKWKTEFAKGRTKRGQFMRPYNDPADATFMTFEENQKFMYSEDENVQVLDMPYKGDDISMTVVLPKVLENGILKANAALYNLDSLLDCGRNIKIHVKFPKFKLEKRMLLKGPLSDMGMGGAFSDDADFSGMTTTTNREEQLHFSEVVQKSYVAVGEEGTEAAAATAAIMKCRSIEMSKEFVADHPFVFLIRHRPTGIVLFMGRVEDTSGLDK